ncbi:MAG TPA: nuclear transport factor 2 family protein [bacterium]|nr:nuclear transport factor 2 family protein [bacterium]
METERLLQTDREFSTYSVEHGAAAAFQRYLLPNARQLPAGGMPIQCRENIYQNMIDSDLEYTMRWAPQEGKISSSADLGYTWGIYRIRFETNTGDTVSGEGKYLNVWKKNKAGDWRVLIDMGNQNPPPE